MKILSYCITCMGRAHQIKETLLENLRNNSGESDMIEFVVVDFGKNDGLEQFIFKNCVQYLQNGYLKYFKTDELLFWHASIAKNTAHILAEGVYVCNLDCDNFTGEGGGANLIQLFKKYGNNVLIHQPTYGKGGKSNGTYGRISMSRENFKKLGGYDEQLFPMGYQDNDIINRAEMCHIKIIKNENTPYSSAIPQNKSESIANIDGCGKTWRELQIFNSHICKMKYSMGIYRVNGTKKTLDIGINKNILRAIVDVDDDGDIDAGVFWIPHVVII